MKFPGRLELILLGFFSLTFLLIPMISSAEITKSYGERYAVIAVGNGGSQDLYNWSLMDAQEIYSTLTERYGFEEENVFVLVTMDDKYQEPSDFNPSIIDRPSTDSDLKEVMEGFKDCGEHDMGSCDLLFSVVISHGNRDIFYMRNGSVTSSEYADYLSGIDGREVIVLQPCMSESFVDDISDENRIVITSMNSEEEGGGWSGVFAEGLDGGGEKVSVEEVFRMAAEHVYEEYGLHSLLDDNADNQGHNPITDAEDYSINNPSKDGYVAANTFLSKELPGYEICYVNESKQPDCTEAVEGNTSTGVARAGATGRILSNPAPAVSGILLLLVTGVGIYWRRCSA